MKSIPIYTGGGTYLITGNLDDNYFIANTDYFDIAIVSEDPTSAPIETITDIDYIESNLVRYITSEAEKKLLFYRMMQNVDKANPLTNYDPYELEFIICNHFGPFTIHDLKPLLSPEALELAKQIELAHAEEVQDLRNRIELLESEAKTDDEYLPF